MERPVIVAPTEPADALPVVRAVHLADLRDALRSGLDDFRAMPTHVVFLSVLYPIVGLVLSRALFVADLVPLLYPLAAGFALVGPFAAIGLYELSRRRELGLDTSWTHAFDIVHSPSLGAILALGLLLLAIFPPILLLFPLYEGRRYDEAAESLSQLAALYPDDSDAHYDLANARYATGQVCYGSARPLDGSLAIAAGAGGVVLALAAGLPSQSPEGASSERPVRPRRLTPYRTSQQRWVVVDRRPRKKVFK